MEWLIELWSRLNTSDVIAMSAVLVALCALVTTLWQAHVARAHNRLSVRPHLAWNINRVRANRGCELVFTLENCGVGPAIVVDRFFSVDGARYPASGHDAVEKLLSTVIGEALSYHLRQNGLPGVGSPIPAGRSYVVAHIFFPLSSIEVVDEFMDRADVGFQVHYECLYRRRFHLTA